MGIEDRRALLVRIIGEKLEELETVPPVAVSDLALETPLDSLGLDSMHYIEVINEIEEQLGIELPYSANDGKRLETLGDLLGLLEGVEVTG